MIFQLTLTSEFKNEIELLIITWSYEQCVHIIASPGPY